MQHKSGAALAPPSAAPTPTTPTLEARGGPMAAPEGSGGSPTPPSAQGSSSGSSTGGTVVVSRGDGPPLRSALKRAGQKSRGHRVCINEARNEFVDADYVILVHEEIEPQLVSIKSFDLKLGPDSTHEVDQVTLSPPEGYKDSFSHAVHETIVDDSEIYWRLLPLLQRNSIPIDTESGSVDGRNSWSDGEGSSSSSGGDPRGGGEEDRNDPGRPGSDPSRNLPDLVNVNDPGAHLTVENVRHHDKLMEEKDTGSDDKVVKTGILKGGKLWKNGDHKNAKKTKTKLEIVSLEEPRRSVRFSGRDEYSTLDASSPNLDVIPLEAATPAALAKLLSPPLRELGALLAERASAEDKDNWQVELSPISGVPDSESDASEKTMVNMTAEEQQLNDEQIGESMRRYEEMRRRAATVEGRDNASVCSDESKSSTDSYSSDSTMTETRIRRLENSDVAHVAGGILRSNNEVRRAIERNALRRSLTRIADARKKDTNKNDKVDKVESSLVEKLRWLTASEDATNGNQEEGDDQGDDQTKQIGDPKVQETIEQYRKLAEMFNKRTSLRGNDITVPGDVREWKLQADLFPSSKETSQKPEVSESQEVEPLASSTTTSVYKAVPAVSLCEVNSDDDGEKLIYSGGVRYTREGTLPLPGPEDEEEESENKEATPSTSGEARKQFLSQMAAGKAAAANGLNNSAGRDRSSVASNSDSYTLEDIDEALNDDRSSSVPSSSQSSPRLSGRSDVDGTSTTESGYSSNETNGEIVGPIPADVDELAEFVRQDAMRMERLRRRYDPEEIQDYGFNRRPSVRGIKPRFGSTTDLLKQMANQLAPPPMAQPGMAGSHMTWPYREVGNEEEGQPSQGTSTLPPQRRRAAPARANTLPAVQEDAPFTTTSEPSESLTATSPLARAKAPRVVHVYASTGDLHHPPGAPPPPHHHHHQPPGPRESPPPDLIRPGTAPQAQLQPRAHSTLPRTPHHGSTQSLVMGTQMASSPQEHFPPMVRRPASVHGHVPPDALVLRQTAPSQITRPHSSLGTYPQPQGGPPTHSHSLEDPPQGTPAQTSHAPLAPRGSYPGTVPHSHFGPQYPSCSATEGVVYSHAHPAYLPPHSHFSSLPRGTTPHIHGPHTHTQVSPMTPGQQYPGQHPHHHVHAGQPVVHHHPRVPVPVERASSPAWPHPSQPHPGQAHPVQQHQGQPHPSQPHPGQPHPGQPHPGQPHPGQPHPGQPHPGQPHPGQPHPGQPHPVQSHPGQPHPSQPHTVPPHSGQPHPGQPHPGQPHTVPPHSGQPHLGQPHPVQPHPVQTHPGQPHPGQPHPGQPHPGQPHPGQPHPAHLHPGQPHPGQHHHGQAHMVAAPHAYPFGPRGTPAPSSLAPQVVSSHSYTTPIVPVNSVASIVGPPRPALVNGGFSKLEGPRDERGVPEGASSSPRGGLDPQYTPHGSPGHDPALPIRHAQPMNVT